MQMRATFEVSRRLGALVSTILNCAVDRREETRLSTNVYSIQLWPARTVQGLNAGLPASDMRRTGRECLSRYSQRPRTACGEGHGRRNERSGSKAHDLLLGRRDLLPRVER